MGKGNFTGTYVRDVQRLVYEESDLQYARDAFVRFDCCFFLLCISGRCIIETGTHSYSIDAKSAFMSPAWTEIKVSESTDDFLVRMILFPKERFLEAIMPMDASLFRYTHYNPLCRNCTPALNKWLDMARFLFLESYDKSQIKGQGRQLMELEEKDFLQGMFLWIRRKMQTINIEIPVEKNRMFRICHNFLELVHEFAATEHNVQFYADRLCITPRYLDKITAEYIEGMSPKKIIDDQVLAEIKTRLRNSDLSVTQIAADMNFSDQTYMSSFFRRLAGISPTEFRKSLLIGPVLD